MLILLQFIYIIYIYTSVKSHKITYIHLFTYLLKIHLIPNLIKITMA